MLKNTFDKKKRLQKKVPSPEGPEDFCTRNPRDSELKNAVVNNFDKKTITKESPKSRGSRGFLDSEPSGLGTKKHSCKIF